MSLNYNQPTFLEKTEAYARLAVACKVTESLWVVKDKARTEAESREKDFDEALANEQRLQAEYVAINAAYDPYLETEYTALVAAYVVVAESFRNKTYIYNGAANGLAAAIAPSLSGARQYQAWEEAVRSVYAEK